MHVLLLCIAFLLSGCKTTVPSLKGLKKDKAAKLVASAGLELSVAETYNAKIAKGRVISQIPASSKGTTRGSLVMVIISKGKPARLMFGKLAFSRRDIDVGGKAVVSVKLSNVGDAPGRWHVVMTQDGKVAQTKRVVVAGHGRKVVQFPIASQQPGVHRLKVRGGPAGVFVVRTWVVVASLSGQRSAPKRLGKGMPYYPGMPAYHPDQFHHVSSPPFTLTESSDLKLARSRSNDMGGHLSVDVVPSKSGRPSEDHSYSTGRDDNGDKLLTRGPGEYTLDVQHANCDWTVTLWVKR